MKVKLLKKVRKQYQIVYREKPYVIQYAYSKLIGNFRIKGKSYVVFKTKQEALDYIINHLRGKYNKLGNHNRKEKLKEQETKVWYNGN